MGNLRTIEILLDGFTVSQIEEKCGNILCGSKKTSCTGQLAIAVRKAYDESEA